MKRLLLFFAFVLLTTLTFSQVPQIERDALIELYSATNGPNWTNSTNWNTAVPVSTWYGITVTNDRVTSISLDSNNLSGTIPESFSNLTELTTFSIRLNGIFGSFPLTSFINQTKLEYVDINSNFMSGFIPPEISNLTNLWYLDIGWNSFSGIIPPEMTTLLNLQYAYLHNNQISGNIPTGPGNMPSLEILYLVNNNLSGIVPDLSILPSLTYFDISSNQFLFADIEPNYVALNTYFGANFVYAPQQNIGNAYSEAVPIGGSTTLMIENIGGSQNNYIWSRINADGSEGGVIGNSPTIDITINTADDYKWFYFYEVTSPLVPGLTLRSEFFTLGDLPSNHPDYDALIAIYNAFDGANWTDPWDITKPIHNWTEPYVIGFDPITYRVINLELQSNGGVNPISGTIPPEIGDLSELTSLVIINNDISGEIPPEIWTLTKLKTLILGGQESGQLLLSNGIPPEIANLQELEWLNLTQVPLTQPLQPELFNLPNLLRLRIVECGLTGTLPAELAGISDVLAYGNEFEGDIPQEFVDAVGNSNLNIAGNYFNFANLEPLVMANNYNTLGYSPQRTKDVVQNLEFAPGTDIVLNIDDTSLNKIKSSKGIGDEYQWYKDNDAISGANAISYTITNAQESDSGVYYCQITNPLLTDLIITRASITLLIDAALSTEETIVNNINIYPNPTKNVINIKLKNHNKAEASLYDISGRLVLKQKLHTGQSVLDIKSLSVGMYILKIKTDNKTATKRIIKQ